MTIQGAAKDLRALAGMEGDAEFQAEVKGSVDVPAVEAKGRITLADLKARGLGDIMFTMSSENLQDAPAGHIHVASAYQEMPLSVDADYKYADSVLALMEIAGAAPDLRVSGAVDVDTGTMLADGTLSVQVDKLAPYAALLGQEIAGSVSADIVLMPQEERQGAEIKARGDSVTYDAYRVAAVDINAVIPDVMALWPREMDIKASGVDLGGDVNVSAFEGTITDSGNDMYQVRINASGHAVQDFAIKGSAGLAGLRSQVFSAQDIDVTLRSEGSAVTASGAIDQNAVDLELSMDGIALGSLPVSVPVQLRDTAISGSIAITGAPAMPVMDGALALTPFAPVEGTSVEISIKPSYRDGRAGVSVNGTGDAIETLSGQASFPVSVSLMPFEFALAEDAALSGQVNMDADAGAVNKILLPPGHILRGGIQAQAEIAGSIAAPDISGDVRLNGGEYEYVEYGVQLFDLQLAAAFDDERVQIKTFSAHDGENGRLNGTGVYDFSNAGASDIDLTITDYHLFDSDKADGSVSADLSFTGQADGYLLGGDIRLGQIDVIIPERFQTSIPELNIVKEEGAEQGTDMLEAVALDIDVQADNRVFVRGWGLDAEFGGELEVTGTLADPQISGALSAERGRYEEFGRRFDLARADLRFQGQMPPSPYFDIVATAQLEEIEANVNLTGEFDNPDISFSSVPSLPEDEVMARILFGENLSNITPFQAVRLKQTLDRFSGRGGGGFDPLGQLRAITGLDDISVDTEGEETSVGVGKYLTDDVYLELEKGQGENSGAAKVQIEVTPDISVESEVGEDARAGAGVLWKWDY